METRDTRIDAYIARSADFAQPILRRVREIVHQGCPKVEETMKWSFPHFMYKGMLCSMASFKEHCAFGFWKGSLVLDGAGKSADAMGQFGRITSLKDLPSKSTFLGYVKKARQINDEGVKVPRKAKPQGEKKDLVAPDYFLAAVKKNWKALAAFEKFSYSHKKEYVQWVTEAKTGETRTRRLQTSVEWLAQGKSRNWKYERCSGTGL
ncbi:MAG TPA: YdeI/OmpD-associated family protein [Candidatus Angelobacter sp.]